MAVLPDKELELIQFCEAHAPIWAAAPTSIGLTALQVAALTTLTTNARKAFGDAQTARQASKAQTTTYHASTGSLRSNVADLVRLVKAFAENTANPNAIYAAAQIPPPAAPTPPPPPGPPTNVTVGLNPDGSITLRWKTANASPSAGVFFQVARRIGATSAYAPIGGASGGPRGVSEFVDNTLPLGTQQASYIIQGRRGTQVGQASEAINIQFGVGGGLSISSGATLALAA